MSICNTSYLGVCDLPNCRQCCSEHMSQILLGYMRATRSLELWSPIFSTFLVSPQLYVATLLWIFVAFLCTLQLVIVSGRRKCLWQCYYYTVGHCKIKVNKCKPFQVTLVFLVLENYIKFCIMGLIQQ